jgi:hypothetical protein
MMEAWLSSSEMMMSSLPRIAETVPALAVKPDWKTTDASTFLKRAIFSSSSMWIDMVPAMVRTAPEPTPHFSVASKARLAKLGVRGQSQIIVGREVDDFMAVETRNGKLLRFQNAQLLEQLLFAQLYRVHR